VRRLGKSYAHPLIVLISHPNGIEISRFAVVAGRSVGNAVQRNRVKRRIREAVRPNLPKISSGWDIILLARKPILEAKYEEVRSAVVKLLQRADLMHKQDVN
jgi:ribonuclease P protein component